MGRTLARSRGIAAPSAWSTVAVSVLVAVPRVLALEPVKISLAERAPVGLEFSPDGSRLVADQPGSPLRTVLDPGSGVAFTRFRIPEEAGTGKRLPLPGPGRLHPAAAGARGALLDLASGSVLAAFAPGGGKEAPQVAAVALHPEGRWLAVAGTGVPVRVHPLVPGATPLDLTGTEAGGTGLLVSADGATLVVETGGDALLFTVEAGSARPRGRMRPHEGSFRLVRVEGGPELLACFPSPRGGAKGQLWTSGGRAAGLLDPGDEEEQQVALYRKRIATADRRRILVRDRGQDAPLARIGFEGTEGETVASLRYSPCGRWLAAGGSLGSIRVIACEGGLPLGSGRK